MHGPQKLKLMKQEKEAYRSHIVLSKEKETSQTTEDMSKHDLQPSTLLNQSETRCSENGTICSSTGSTSNFIQEELNKMRWAAHKSGQFVLAKMEKMDMLGWISLTILRICVKKKIVTHNNATN